jgi:hypothetical protein
MRSVVMSPEERSVTERRRPHVQCKDKGVATAPLSQTDGKGGPLELETFRLDYLSPQKFCPSDSQVVGESYVITCHRVTKSKRKSHKSRQLIRRVRTVNTDAHTSL